MLLVTGFGPLLASLLHALHESGITSCHMDGRQVASWREAVQPFDAVLYVSQEGNIGELKQLHSICKTENKAFLPALCIGSVGLVGPLTYTASDGCWESAWRAIHRTALGKSKPTPISSAALEMLANALVFEWSAAVARQPGAGFDPRFYRLDLETLEGQWHSFHPHPLASGSFAVQWVEDVALQLRHSPSPSKEWLAGLERLTSSTSGLFHHWGEGETPQLPLAQCGVRPVDPLSEGPAELLPEIICCGFTHDEARREAGLAGLEAYTARMSGLLMERTGWEDVGIGAGETFAEGVCRGLLHWLESEESRRMMSPDRVVMSVQLNADEMEDERCRFYWKALVAIRGKPLIGVEEGVYGFPVAWIGANGRWFGYIGLNLTLAVRRSLQEALRVEQNRGVSAMPQGEEAAVSVPWQDGERSRMITVPLVDLEKTGHHTVLESALERLNAHKRKLLAAEIAGEVYGRQGSARVFGVSLAEVHVQ